MEDLTRPIFLITDFGHRDAFVFQVKAAIAAIAPRAPIVDITHEIEPGAIEEAAWTLETNLADLPEGAVIMVVLDPGVGTERKAVALESSGRTFVGPDNGVLSPALPAALRPCAGSPPGAIDVSSAGIRAHELADPRYWRLPSPGATFHGRDIFGPVAAHITSGVDVAQLGPPAATLVALPRFEGNPGPAGAVRGHVVHVDRYGNLISTIPASALRAGARVYLAGREVVQATTFGAVPNGALLAYPDSSGFVAIASNGGNAARQLEAGRGTAIEVLLPS